ncbi:MAG: peroxidase-related enzyme [Rhodospirillales bacterium]|nr:peroxidase-related enzyme [Rhodospirillales bacterium]
MPQPGHIAKINLPDPETLDEDIRKYLALCREKVGLVPNVLLAFTAKPEKFRTFTKFYNQIMLDEETCRLSKLEREMIAVVVSSANRCYYCLVAHGHAVRQLSGDPQLGEMLVMNYRTAKLDSRTRAMLDYAWKVTLRSAEVGDADREALKDAGLDEGEIFDVTDVVALFNYTNRLMQGLDVMPNPEYHAMDR